jgi:hypothetical protein
VNTALSSHFKSEGVESTSLKANPIARILVDRSRTFCSDIPASSTSMQRLKKFGDTKVSLCGSDGEKVGCLNAARMLRAARRSIESSDSICGPRKDVVASSL